MGSTAALSEVQGEVFVAICDAFFPPLTDREVKELAEEFSEELDANEIAALCKWTPSRVNILERFNRLLEGGYFTPEVLRDTKLGLSILSTAAGTFLLCGHARPFTALGHSEKFAVLHGWSTSHFITKRKLFNLFKTLSALFFVGVIPDNAQTSPLWKAMGYPGPHRMLEQTANREAAKKKSESAFSGRFLKLRGDTEMHCDVLVVGSGIGGSIVASELAQAGQKVIVLEKGRFFKPDELTLVEMEAAESMYDRGGLLQTEDQAVSVFAANTFGGGGTVNWMCSLQTQHHVRKEWAEKYGLTHLLHPSYQESLDFVCQRMGVHTKDIPHNSANRMLERGCKQLGYPVEECPQAGQPQEADGADAAFCGFGWKYGERQGTQGSFLQDAAHAGTMFIEQCEVQRVTQHRGRATGVVATVAGKHQLRIKSSVVVSSCGSIHTPALLLRSQLRNPNIGCNLRLHPVTTLYGVFPKEDISVFNGPPMTMVSRAVQNQDGQGYGALIEVPAAHAGFTAMGMPLGKCKTQTRRQLLQCKHTLPLIVLLRDCGSGSVTVDQYGQPRLNYKLCTQDSKHMLQGLEAGAKILVAAGASTVGTLQAGLDAYRTTSEGVADAGFSGPGGWLEKMHRRGLLTHGCPFFSAHQMGSCRMGTSADSSVVNPQGETWEVHDLFVADASLFPTPSGTNPMVTTAALAHGVAKHIKARMQRARM